jgi:hypothetical protein
LVDGDGLVIATLALVLLLEAPPSGVPQTFVAHYHARAQALQTGVVRSVWEDFDEKKPTRRDRQTVYLDNLGRRRLQMQSEQPKGDGTWVRHEQVPYEWDKLFDGEITASLTFDPRKDRVGNDPAPGAKTSGYRAAQIFNGEWEIKKQRSPLSFADGIVTRLESAIQNSERVELEEDTAGRATLRFPNDKDGGFWRLTVDKTRDWVPVMIAQCDKSAKVLMRTDLEYATTASAIWYPKKGSLRYYGNRLESETPLYETRFEVTECRINDPQFDEGIFTIKLDPETAVWDSRYNVNYRIGDEQIIGERLEGLAKAALAVQKLEPPAIPDSRRAGGRWMLVWANAALLALLLAGVGFRRWVKR